ncbi:MAG: hypothetical protein RR189_02705 [Bacilli bacterium]
MKLKKYKEKYSKKASKKNTNVFKKKDTKWIIEITLVAFIITFLLSIASELTIPNVNIIVSIIIVFVFVLLGIIFDMIGISVTVADPKVFNSMASKKMKAAKVSLKLMKNANKVSSFCNDVIGDICGILSGSATAMIALNLIDNYPKYPLLITILITSIVASFTIGGKALGKSFAINKSNNIVFKVSKILSKFMK